MLLLAPDVRLHGLRPEMVLAASIVDAAYAALGVLECVVTSGIEGRHSTGSEHYAGLALDFRIHNVPDDQRGALHATIKRALGGDFDVLLETAPPHLHVEFDPKHPY